MNISVVVCTFNGEAYIEEQLRSILHQTRKVDEIILLDDCSLDNTVKNARKILDDSDIPYQIVCNSRNLGVAANFEKGIRKATGEIILTADQDDVWLEKKVECFEKIFKTHSDCVLAFSDGYVTDSVLNITRDSLWEAVHFTRQAQRLFHDHNYYEVLFTDNVVTGAAMGLRREFALSCMSAPEGTLHDYWFALCAPLHGEIAFLSVPCILYRQHGKNVMGVPGHGLKGKIRRWLRTIDILEKDKKSRLKRAMALYEYAQQCQNTRNYTIEFSKWVEFCTWRSGVSNKGTLVGIFQIIKYTLRGDYRKYVNKQGIFFQDIVSCIIKKKRENK